MHCLFSAAAFSSPTQVSRFGGSGECIDGTQAIGCSGRVPGLIGMQPLLQAPLQRPRPIYCPRILPPFIPLTPPRPPPLQDVLVGPPLLHHPGRHQLAALHGPGPAHYARWNPGMERPHLICMIPWIRARSPYLMDPGCGGPAAHFLDPPDHCMFTLHVHPIIRPYLHCRRPRSPTSS